VKAEPRRTPPMAVKLAAALNQLEAAMRQLGMIPVECTVPDWQFDHDPALALRAVDEATAAHVPHQHDVRFLVWRPRVEHAVKTTGRRGESDLSLRDGDQSKIAKLKRRDKKRAAEQAPAESPREHLKGKRSMRRQPAEKLSPCRTPEKLRALKELRR
jgi:hypothetical protein